MSEEVKLCDCPIGLFMSASGELCLKTEYGNNEGRIDAYIVSSGEFFWGSAPQTIASQRAQMVTPVKWPIADPAPQPATSTVEVEPVAWRWRDAHHWWFTEDRDIAEHKQAAGFDVDQLIPASALSAALEDKKRAVERVTELETAARHIWPYLVYTIGEESPGHHPTMPSAVGAFSEVVGLDVLKKLPYPAAITKERSE